MPQLPDHPADLIRHALADLEAIEADPRYRVNMNVWHSFTSAACEVCLAGAVLAKSVGRDATSSFEHLGDAFENLGNPFLHDSSDSCFRKLCALDAFMRGDVPGAFEHLRMGISPLHCRHITEYALDPSAFKADMRRLADDLDTAMRPAVRLLRPALLP